MDEEVNIYPCGLVISSWSPWIAATPDRKVFCPSLNPPHGLLEIKCPVNPLADCVYLKWLPFEGHPQVLLPNDDPDGSHWTRMVPLLCVDTRGVPFRTSAVQCR